MTTDEKIDELLKIAIGYETRLDRLEAKDNELSQKVGTMSDLLLEERQLNTARASQISSALSDVRNDIGDIKAGLARLDAKVDRVHESLATDINAFGEDLYETKLRVTRLEKKLLS